jgi:hypothetical protein
MTLARNVAIAFGLLLGLSACGASNGFTVAKQPCGENVGPDYTSIGAPGAAPANLNLGSSAQGCS